jgi:hypothetical protein
MDGSITAPARSALVEHINHMPRPSDTQARKALRHALRRKLYLLFVIHQPLSTREAARLVGEPLSLVAYHVRGLVRLHFLVLDSTEPVRGAVKSYYVPNEDAMDLPAVTKLMADLPIGPGKEMK